MWRGMSAEPRFLGNGRTPGSARGEEDNTSFLDPETEATQEAGFSCNTPGFGGMETPTLPFHLASSCINVYRTKVSKGFY